MTSRLRARHEATLAMLGVTMIAPLMRSLLDSDTSFLRPEHFRSTPGHDEYDVAAGTRRLIDAPNQESR